MRDECIIGLEENQRKMNLMLGHLILKQPPSEVKVKPVNPGVELSTKLRST